MCIFYKFLVKFMHLFRIDSQTMEIALYYTDTKRHCNDSVFHSKTCSACSFFRQTVIIHELKTRKHLIQYDLQIIYIHYFLTICSVKRTSTFYEKSIEKLPTSQKHYENELIYIVWLERFGFHEIVLNSCLRLKRRPDAF